jgi:predicted  nucleic acid-binding Zn-ribbon protein
VTAAVERRRREWRVELREAALERKGLKERIAQLEARAEQQREMHRATLEGLAAALDNHRQTIEHLLVENNALKAQLENK